MGAQFFVHVLSLYCGQIIDIAIMQRPGHAVLHTLRVAVAQIAFCGNLSAVLKMNIPKRTGSDAHFAANAGGFIHHDGVGDRIAIEIIIKRASRNINLVVKITHADLPVPAP